MSKWSVLARSIAERDVEQDDVEVLRAGAIDRGPAVGDRGHVVAVACEETPDLLAQF